jgi:hypothetical protein
MENVVGGVLSDVHFVIFKGVHGEVIGRMRWVVINGLVEMGRQESTMVLMRDWGRGGIDGHETVSRHSTGLEDLAQFPTGEIRSGRARMIGRGHGKLGSGVRRDGMPGRGACHVERGRGEWERRGYR